MSCTTQACRGDAAEAYALLLAKTRKTSTSEDIELNYKTVKAAVDAGVSDWQTAMDLFVRIYDGESHHSTDRSNPNVIFWKNVPKSKFACQAFNEIVKSQSYLTDGLSAATEAYILIRSAEKRPSQNLGLVEGDFNDAYAAFTLAEKAAHKQKCSIVTSAQQYVTFLQSSGGATHSHEARTGFSLANDLEF